MSASTETPRAGLRVAAAFSKVSFLTFACASLSLIACSGDSAADEASASAAPRSLVTTGASSTATPSATAPRYWSVQTRGALCRILPRPDGDATLVAECARTSDLSRTLAESQLCKYAESSFDVKAVESLRCADAARIAAFLNTDFKFQIRGGATTYPALRDADVALACASNETLRTGVLHDACAFEAGRCVDGVCRAGSRGLRELEVRAIVPELNRLYGASR